MQLYHKRICLKKEMTKEVLTFKEMLQLLKEVFVTNNEFIMLNHECNIMSTSSIFSPIANNIISWVNKERIDVIVSSDEVELGIVGSNAK